MSPASPDDAPARSGPGFRLLAITPPAGTIDVAVVDAWSAARAVGLAVLLREPGTPPRALLDDAHRLAPLRRACAEAGVPCLLSVDAAALPSLTSLSAAALVAGVQLRGDPDPAALRAARAGLGPGQRLGRSCHRGTTPMPALVDYSVLAPIYAPHTASPVAGPGKQPIGLGPLRALAQGEPHVFALGGITPARAAACLEAGAFGLAAIRSFFGPRAPVADNVARLVESLAEPARHGPPPR